MTCQNQIYRKVHVDDRLPEKQGEYITNLGEVNYIKRSSGKWIVDSVHYPEWWLEEIGIEDRIERLTRLCINTKRSFQEETDVVEDDENLDYCRSLYRANRSKGFGEAEVISIRETVRRILSKIC